jgi:hypothetical protein
MACRTSPRVPRACRLAEVRVKIRRVCPNALDGMDRTYHEFGHLQRRAPQARVGDIGRELDAPLRIGFVGFCPNSAHMTLQSAEFVAN